MFDGMVVVGAAVVVGASVVVGAAVVVGASVVGGAVVVTAIVVGAEVSAAAESESPPELLVTAVEHPTSRAMPKTTKVPTTARRRCSTTTVREHSGGAVFRVVRFTLFT
jgi:tetrahydrodipicolinate N-succinyltransferase